MNSPRFVHQRQRNNFRYATVVGFLLGIGALVACQRLGTQLSRRTLPVIMLRTKSTMIAAAHEYVVDKGERQLWQS